MGRDPREDVARRLQVQDVGRRRSRMPQHARRLKVRRKDLRKPDEFETLTGQAVDWAQQNRPIVFAVAGVAILAALIALVVGRWRNSRNESAATMFLNAQAAFSQSSWTDA